MRFQAEDFNFWGVTFARGGDRFYATLSTAGKTYLVQGDMAAQEGRIIAENVECPSLSPDGTRIVYKKRVGGGGLDPVIWRLHLLDLATLTSTPLAETRNIDDQVEWIDDRHVLYSYQDDDTASASRPDLWQLTLNGSAPRLMRTGAMSPSVIRYFDSSPAGPVQRS